MSTAPNLQIVGILNVTSDSFSDGNQYLEPATAIEKARQLVAQGADIIDIGAESSNPDGKKITPEEEIQRLDPVIKALKGEQIRVSVDTYKPEVMEYAIARGVDMINDITALRDRDSVEVVRKGDVPVVIMFARNEGPHAERTVRDHTIILDELDDFFSERLAALKNAGLADDQVIIDPGMGLFIGGSPEPSLMVLRHIKELKKFGREIYLSPSRKSFIGAVLNRPLSQRSIGTLATEIWAWLHGVRYIRTHEPEPLRDAVRMLHAIEAID